MKEALGSFISLGAGDNQLPLILAAKKLGLKIIAVDKNQAAPGFLESDVRILESTFEYRKILHAMSQVPLAMKPLGVGSRSFGKAVYSTAYLAEKLRLRGNPKEAVEAFSKKDQINTTLRRVGIPVPADWTKKWNQKDSPKKTTLPFPFIAKPTTGSTKKGIRFLQNDKDLASFIKGHKKNPYFLEEFVNGDEITVLGFILSRKFHLISITDKITSGAPDFLEIAHVLPSQHEDLAGELKMLCQSIIRAMDLKYGPFVAEFKIQSKKNIVLIESQPEVGGEYLADHLLRFHFGYDYFKDLVELLIGKKIQPRFLSHKKSNHKKSAIVFRLLPTGVKLIPSHTPFEKELGETIFFEKNLLAERQSSESLEGNERRTKVIGISKEFPSPDWIYRVIDRLQK